MAKTQRKSALLNFFIGNNPKLALKTEELDPTLFPQSNLFLEGITTARKAFLDYEKKSLEDQVKDQSETIAINKQMISELFQTSQDPSQSMLLKLNQENKMLNDRMAIQCAENRRMASEKLVLEQMSLQLESQKVEDENILKRRIEDLKESLGRKELFLQQREKRWVDVQNLIMPLYQANPQLKTEMDDLKLHTQGEISIENVVSQNQKLLGEVKDLST